MAAVTDSFKIVLQKGIHGGFAPPIPDALYTLTRDPKSDVFVVSAQKRPHSTPQLLPAQTQELSVADHAVSIARLQELLRDIPPQYPGAQDLYGRNTSIVQVTDQAAGVTALHMSGSHAGFGASSPTEEQKAKFDEAVTIILSFELGP